MSKPVSRKVKNQGMNWIRPERRLGIYLRDGMACVYCESTIEDGERLTLDHVMPYSKGGDNSNGNLVTSCNRCNASRGNRSVASFCKTVAAYLNHGIKAIDILSHVNRTRRRVVDIDAAKALIARRGGFTAAIRQPK